MILQEDRTQKKEIKTIRESLQGYQGNLHRIFSLLVFALTMFTAQGVFSQTKITVGLMPLTLTYEMDEKGNRLGIGTAFLISSAQKEDVSGRIKKQGLLHENFAGTSAESFDGVQGLSSYQQFYSGSTNKGERNAPPSFLRVERRLNQNFLVKANYSSIEFSQIAQSKFVTNRTDQSQNRGMGDSHLQHKEQNSDLDVGFTYLFNEQLGIGPRIGYRSQTLITNLEETILANSGNTGMLGYTKDSLKASGRGAFYGIESHYLFSPNAGIVWIFLLHPSLTGQGDGTVKSLAFSGDAANVWMKYLSYQSDYKVHGYANILMFRYNVTANLQLMTGVHVESFYVNYPSRTNHVAVSYVTGNGNWYDASMKKSGASFFPTDDLWSGYGIAKEKKLREKDMFSVMLTYYFNL